MVKMFAIFLQVFPTILQLMGLAEKIFSDKPNSGAEKKALVMGATQAIIGGIAAVSTGGQAETWQKIKDPVSAIIDNAAAIVFPNDEPTTDKGA